jgi:undecaprenyl-diphosphatase
VALACACVFIAVTILVAVGWIDHLDRTLHDGLVASRGSAIARAGIALAWAGSGAATALVGTALVAARVPAARIRAAGIWLAAIAAGTAFEWVVKPIVARRRPEGIVDALSAAHFGGDLDSFPSGHALSSALLAVIICRLWPHPAARAAAVAWAIAVAASRIVLGVHWPSDVIAGAAAGTALGLVWPLPIARRPGPGRGTR